ncbi:MAG TPA: ergothioneine biosynthesis protein EgtB, partial [Candidatus Binataceae bacterium]|nr:ergothioneine biosynthesis protein EgtB [Candidatus Binataceae bacterium]
MESIQTAKPRDVAARARECVAEQYREVRGFTDRLCVPLAIEDYVVQSMPDASPTKWHLAHVSWFFQTFVLEPAARGARAGRPEYKYLFNSYYNAVGPMYSRPRRGMLSRPTVSEVRDYRRDIDNAMIEFIETVGEREWSRARPIVTLGLNHEQQHQELILTDLKHMLSLNPLRPAYIAGEPSLHTDSPELEWIGFGENVYWIGAGEEDFFFDNEAPRHRTFVHAFELASRPTTVGEFIEFVEGGGYQRPELWLSAGWAAVQENGWGAPLYWEKIDGEWNCFTLAGMRPLNSAEPVCHLSYFEADAFARWRGARLPSEAE